MPLGFGNEEHVRSTESAGAASILARVEVKKGGARTSGVLYDAFGDEALSTMHAGNDQLAGGAFTARSGQLVGRPSKSFRRMRSQAAEPLKVTALKADQSNSTLLYGDKFLLKQFRRLGGRRQSGIGNRRFSHRHGRLFAFAAAGRRDRIRRAATADGHGRRAARFRSQSGNRLELHARSRRGIFRKHPHATAVARVAARTWCRTRRC